METDVDVVTNRYFNNPKKSKNSKNDLISILFTDEEYYVNCTFCKNTLEITQIGNDFYLDKNEFLCLDFNERLISGINVDANEIKQYDVFYRYVVRTIQISGLPKEMICRDFYSCSMTMVSKKTYLFNTNSKSCNSVMATRKRVYFKKNDIVLAFLRGGEGEGVKNFISAKST